MPTPARRLAPLTRRALLILHLVTSVGWNGVALAQLALALTGTLTDDPILCQGAFRLMRVFDLALNVPLGFSALITGVLLGLLQPWGLLLHWWVTLKLIITTFILVFAGAQVRLWVEAAGLASARGLAGVPHRELIITGTAFNALLVTSTILSVIKPWGRTPRGRRLAAQ